MPLLRQAEGLFLVYSSSTSSRSRWFATDRNTGALGGADWAAMGSSEPPRPLSASPRALTASRESRMDTRLPPPCPRQESNLDLPLRRRSSYPLDYEGSRLRLSTQ